MVCIGHGSEKAKGGFSVRSNLRDGIGVRWANSRMGNKTLAKCILKVGRILCHTYGSQECPRILSGEVLIKPKFYHPKILRGACIPDAD